MDRDADRYAAAISSASLGLRVVAAQTPNEAIAIGDGAVLPMLVDNPTLLLAGSFSEMRNVVHSSDTGA